MNKSCLILECQKQILRVELTSIYYMQYQEGITTIHRQGDKQLLSCQALKDLQQQLSGSFVRINRNIIINLSYLSAYKKNSRTVLLEDGSQFSVSRRNIGPLLDKIMGMN